MKGLRDVHDLTPQFTAGRGDVRRPDHRTWRSVHLGLSACASALKARESGLRPLMGPVSGLEGRNDEIGRPLPPLSHRAEAITNAANGQSEHLSVFDQAKWSETGS